jgi:predicted transcriptional regulator
MARPKSISTDKDKYAVLGMIYAGKTNYAIAKILKTSPTTVAKYIDTLIQHEEDEDASNKLAERVKKNNVDLGVPKGQSKRTIAFHKGAAVMTQAAAEVSDTALANMPAMSRSARGNVFNVDGTPAE